MAPDLSMLVDVVDDDNQPVGTVRRRELFANAKNFRTVHILLFCGGQLLMQKLPADHLRSPGKLGSSVAGYVRAGESYDQAAQRKLTSELFSLLPIHDAGEFRMSDLDASKFVRVYWGSIEAIPDFDRQEIDEVVLVDVSQIRQQLQSEPILFTDTFVEVFRYFDARHPIAR